MDIYLLFIIVVMCFDMKIHWKDFNKDFLSRTCTTCVNGIFVLTIFYSHLSDSIYIDMTTGARMQAVRVFLGQLMVTSFMLYSGYGVYEQIKKRPQYVDSLPGKRVARIWLRMAFTVCLYTVLLTAFGERYTITQFLVALTGWGEIGNCNWYIFAILVLYLLTYAAFTIAGDNHKLAIGLLFVEVAFYMLFVEQWKQIWWYDTVMCYPVGMLISRYKSEITERLFKLKNYLLALFLLVLAFAAINHRCFNLWRCDIRSVLFALILVLVTMKIELRSPVLNWFGRNAFWMYMLQRLPMIYLKQIGYATSNPNRTALVTFVVTVAGVFLCEKLFALVDRWLFGVGKNKVQAAG